MQKIIVICTLLTLFVKNTDSADCTVNSAASYAGNQCNFSPVCTERADTVADCITTPGNDNNGVACCALLQCDAYTCSACYLIKTDPVNIDCPGAGCDDATCCDIFTGCDLAKCQFQNSQEGLACA